MGKNVGRNLQYGPRTRLVRGIYRLLIATKATESRGFKKVTIKISYCWRKTRKEFSLIRCGVSETFVHVQFKILNDINQNDLCTFCNASQKTVDRVFLQCLFPDILG